MKPLTVSIDNIDYKIKLDWKPDEYIKIFSTTYTLSPEQIFSDENNWDNIIHNITGCPIETLERASSIEKSKIIWVLDSVKYFESNIKIKNLNNITFGEFVDLDVYFFNNPLKYWEDIITILTDEPKENIYIWDAYYAFNSFLEWRLWLYKQYKGLFGWQETFERDPEENLQPQSITEIAGHWYNVICVLSGEDINKIDQTTEQPLIKVLNFLARKKEKDNELLMEQRKINNRR